MAKLLHIIATPRGDESRTLKVSASFLGSFGKCHPDCVVDTLDLYKTELPELTIERVDGKYELLSGGDLSGKKEQAWEGIIKLINQFRSYDVYLITAPMWNFSIPYRLKHYIDIIIQPKYMFKYTPDGPEGLVKNKKMVIITSRGGDYSQGEAKNFDFQQQYLTAVFGFVGIDSMEFINAQPMDAMGEGVQKEKIHEAKIRAEQVAIQM